MTLSARQATEVARAWWRSTSDYMPVDYFRLFFPDEAFDLIVTETNRYGEQFFDNPSELPTHSGFRQWYNTDASEMKA